MRAENPAALRFILQDDIYLLQSDKIFTGSTVIQPIAEELPEPTAHTRTLAETPAIQFNYLGKNKKGFLVLTWYHADEFISDAHLTALQNILKRKAYEMDDVAILNMAKNTTAGLDDLLTGFNPQKLLILGRDALPAKMEAPALNQLKPVQNCMVLYSFSFDDMMSSTDNKKVFWDQMKNL